MNNRVNQYSPSLKKLKPKFILSHFSLVVFLWDIGKQYSPRWDDALFYLLSLSIEEFHRKNFFFFLNHTCSP